MWGSEHPKLAIYTNNLARVFQDTGALQQAEDTFRRAIAMYEASVGPKHPDVAAMRANLAVTLLDRGMSERALVEAEDAWTLSLNDGTAPVRRARVGFVLARVLWRARSSPEDRARARTLAQDALHVLDSTDSTRAQGVRDWLAAR